MRATAKKTAIAKLRQRDLTQLQEVCQLLNWSHDEYCNDQFHQYLKFIEQMFEGYPDLAQEVSYSPVFRGFWNNEWMKRNEQQFLPFALEMTKETTEIDIYGDLNIMEGAEPGEDFLISNYLHLHSIETLMHCEQFMYAYNHIIQILCKL